MEYRKAQLKDLADCIRKGAREDGKQIYGSFFAFGAHWGTGAYQVTGCCAAGAALLGAGADVPGDPERALYERFPISRGNIYKAIVHLNDDVRLTREEIADWVEKL